MAILQAEIKTGKEKAHADGDTSARLQSHTNMDGVLQDKLLLQLKTERLMLQGSKVTNCQGRMGQGSKDVPRRVTGGNVPRQVVLPFRPPELLRLPVWENRYSL